MSEPSEERRTKTAEQQLAARLKDAREYLGLSQETVAQQLDIPRASVSAFESARRRVTGIELQSLARLYRTTVSALLDEEQRADPVGEALYRTATTLSDEDREQVLKFAQFLKTAGPYDEARGR